MKQEKPLYRFLWKWIGESKEEPKLHGQLVKVLDRANGVLLPWAVTSLALTGIEFFGTMATIQQAETIEKKLIAGATGGIFVLATLFLGKKWGDTEIDKAISVGIAQLNYFSQDRAKTNVGGPGR